MNAEKAPELTFREMRPGEQGLLVGMTVSVFEKVSIAKNICDRIGSIDGHPWSDYKADEVLADLSASDVVLVAELAGALVSYASIHYDGKYATGRIGHLAVAREAQGRGVGRRTLREALDRMRRDGMKYARVEALQQNPRALALYQSEGFEEVARQVYLFRQLQ